MLAGVRHQIRFGVGAGLRSQRARLPFYGVRKIRRAPFYGLGILGCSLGISFAVMVTSMRRMVLLAALLAISTAASALDFKRFYGRDAVVEGRGGEMESIEGVDYWTNGDPPRRYKIIGYIEDRRHASGLIGMARLKSLPKQVARMGKENGGDAVILVSSENDVVGYASNTTVTGSGNTAYGSGTTVPVAKRESRFAVIQYLPEAQPAANP